MSPNLASLDEDLQAWTLTSPDNSAFHGPSGHGSADASAAMVAAFGQAVSHLSSSLRRRAVQLDLGQGPLPGVPGRQRRQRPRLRAPSACGDQFTEDAADGGMTATAGPSWRMVATLGPAGVSAEGVYPGGQSENPASPWYANLVPLWWDGAVPAGPGPGLGQRRREMDPQWLGG